MGNSNVRSSVINNDNYVNPELIIIPGLAFSSDSYRLGFGKGFFDRYIDNHKSLLTIGVCLPEQLIDYLPTQSHDKKVNFIISYEN